MYRVRSTSTSYRDFETMQEVNRELEDQDVFIISEIDDGIHRKKQTTQTKAKDRKADYQERGDVP